jgi:hypothetical protein
MIVEIEKEASKFHFSGNNNNEFTSKQSVRKSLMQLTLIRVIRIGIFIDTITL